MNFKSGLARYISQFAWSVRGGTPSPAYSMYLSKITESLMETDEGESRSEALRRLKKIDRYQDIYIQDPKGSQEGIAKEIDELATYVESVGIA